MKTTAKPMTKWLLSLVFALVVISLLILPQVLKQEASAITVDDTWYSSHTSDTTLYIATKEQLWSLFKTYYGTDFEGKTIKLTADIDLNPGWDARATVSNNVVTMPSAPDTGNLTRITNFKGTLDGQGHTISGIYAIRTLADSGVDGGLIYNFYGTIKNLAITNSFFCGKRHSWGSVNQGFGSIARYANGGSKLENVYIDADIWWWGDNHYTFGGLYAFLNGTTTVTNVTMAGRFAVAGHSSNDYNHKSGTQSHCGYIAGDGWSNTCTISGFLFCGTKAAPWMSGSGGTGNKNYLVHWSNGSCTASNAYVSAQTSSISGWTNQKGLLGTYTPGNVEPGLYVNHANGTGVSFNNYYSKCRKGSGIYTIATPEEYNYFAYMMNPSRDSTYAAGVTIKLIADLDFGGDATVKSDGVKFHSVTIPTASNNLSQGQNFKGTLDGQGHYIKGVISRQTAYADYNQGAFFIKFNGTLKNLAIIDSFLCGDHRKNSNNEAYTSGNNSSRYGGFAGESDGATFQNIFIDSEVWLITNYANSFGVILGYANGSITAENITITGRFSIATASLTLDRANASGSASGLIVAYCSGNSIAVTMSNIMFSGTRYTYVNGDNSDLSLCVHYNRNGCSLSNYSSTSTKTDSSNYAYWTAKEPTSDSGLGSTYEYLSATGHYVLKANYDMFASSLNASSDTSSQTYSLPLWAQKGGSAGTTTKTVRLIAKIPKCMAENASEVGFYLTRADSGQHATVILQNVYKSITVSGAVQTASSLAGKGEYLFALAIKNAATGVKLTVVPFVTVGGTTYYYKSASYTIS